MREIKFRAWDTKTHRFVSNCNYQLDLNGGLWFHFAYNDPKLKLIDSGDVILEQYIGLKDKYGKEIYEGDIVKDQLGNYKEVYWDERTFDFRMRVNSEMQYDKTYSLIFARFCEIVGNTYQNPELLKLGE